MGAGGIAAAIRARAPFAGAVALAAVALGALFAYSAFMVHPAALPAAIALLVLAAVTVARPEIGLAAAFLMVPLGKAGLAGDPPWLLLAASSGFLLALALARLPAETAGHSRLPRLGFVVLLYLAVAAVGFAVVEDTDAALPGIRILIVGSALFLAVATLVRERKQVQWLLAAAAASAALVGGIAIYEQLTGNTAETGFLTGSGGLVERAAAGFSHPNQLGGYLVLLLPLALAGAATQRRARPLYVAAAALALGGVYVSFSRAALIAVAVIPLIFLRGRHLVVLVPLVALLAVAAAPDLLEQRFATLVEEESTVTSRLDIWGAAIDIWTEQPVLGGGLGGFPDAYSEAQLSGKLFLPSTAFEPPPHAHNLFLHTLAEQGLVGLLALLAVLGVAVRTLLGLRRHPDPWVRTVAGALLASLAAFLVHNIFDVTLVEETGTYFFAVLGLVSALSAIGSRSLDGASSVPSRSGKP